MQAFLSMLLESMFSGGWKDIWVVLYDNSDLCLYNRQGDPEIKAKIHMKVKTFRITLHYQIMLHVTHKSILVFTSLRIA